MVEVAMITGNSYVSKGENGKISSEFSSRTLTSDSTFSSTEQLRKEAPEMYNQILIGIGTTICQKIRHSQEQIKKILREEQHAIARR